MCVLAIVDETIEHGMRQKVNREEGRRRRQKWRSPVTKGAVVEPKAKEC